MRFEILLESERFRAVFALEVFVWRVDFQMRNEILLQTTLERAKGALIDGFFQVLGPVRNQFGNLIGCGVT